MTTSESIRALSRQGMSTAEIARELRIRYQHAYGVLRKDGALPVGRKVERQGEEYAECSRSGSKPSLSVEELLAGGFECSGRWLLAASGHIQLDRPASQDVGVYAFSLDGIVMYVGVATMGIARRLAFYAKPGIGQLTNLRLNRLLKAELSVRPPLEIYTATPGDLLWNGLPVHGSAGLELGLIHTYALPWNVRSTK